MSSGNQDTPRSRGDQGSQPGSRSDGSPRAGGGAGAGSGPASVSGSVRGDPIPGVRRGVGYTPRADVRPNPMFQRLAQTPRDRLPAAIKELEAVASTPQWRSGAATPASAAGGQGTPGSLPSSRGGAGGGTPRDSSDGGSSPSTSTSGSSSFRSSTGAGAGATLAHTTTTMSACIWATTVKLKDTMDRFTEFVQTFRLPKARRGGKKKKAAAKAADGSSMDVEGGGGDEVEEDADDSMPHYLEYIHSIARVHGDEGSRRYASVPVDASHIRAFPEFGVSLYNHVVKYPQEVLPILDLVLNSLYEEVNAARRAAARDDSRSDAGGSGARGSGGSGIGDERLILRSRVFNLHEGEFRRLRDLGPSDIDQLVTVRGMITRTHPVTPDPRELYFQCQHCGVGASVEVQQGRVEEPRDCGSCGAKNQMLRVDNRGTFLDKQRIKMQEAPESVPDGETPHTVSLFLFEHMCETVVPGDRVSVTGVFRAVPVRANPRMRTSKSVFSTYLDVIHFASQEKGRMSQQAFLEGEKEAPEDADGAGQLESASSVAARRGRCEAMAASPSLYTDLSHSLAPSVWEMEDVKKGLLLMMLGGCNKDLGREGKIRGEINVLLCGDPGAAKSQLLRYVHERAPRGIYTSGKGSSAVGLTASIIKDPDTKEPVLESGALVLSDRGICCIDEFDKMSDTTRSILHEVMEQQTVSIAKAGIIATLNARTSILASANPLESRYNPKLSVVENIQLPPTLLSRFDLIYLILDHERPEMDRRLAEHLVSLYHDEASRPSKTAAYSVDDLTTYVSYAKEHCHPQITEEAAQALRDGYLDMRRSGLTGGKKTITATTRQLESIIRLSEAHARMRLSPQVDAFDVAEALRLMHAATQRAAINPRTGTIDMDLLSTGHASGEQTAVTQLADSLRDLLAERAYKSSYTVPGLLKELAAHTDVPLDRELVEAALRQLAQEDAPILAYSKGVATVINAPY